MSFYFEKIIAITVLLLLVCLVEPREPTESQIRPHNCRARMIILLKILLMNAVSSILAEWTVEIISSILSVF